MVEYIFFQKKKGIIVFLLFSLLTLFWIFSNVHAYDLRCDIQVIPFRFQDIVTTKYIQVNTTLTNTGNESFPNSTVYVKILTPDQKLLENYFAYEYSIPDLPVNQSNSYMEPFISSEYAVFSTPLPGTWKVSLQILPLPSNTIVHYEYVDNRAGSCEKYFSVKEFSQYQTDQINIATQNQTAILTQQLKELTTDLRNLTILLIFLSIIAVAEPLYKFASKARGFIILSAGLYGALLYFVIPIQSSFQFISGVPTRYIVGIVLLISTALNLCVNGSSSELHFPLPLKKKIFLYVQIVLVLSNALVLFFISLGLFIETQDYLLWFIGVIFSLLALFSSYSFLDEIGKYEKSLSAKTTNFPM